MDIKSKHVLHIEFNNQTCIFLARVIEHLSICQRSIPSLRRIGGPFSELTVPWFSFETPLCISYPHVSYRHNLYHLTHVVYQTCSADETFSKCPMVFHLKPISKGRPSHEVCLLQAITMVFLQCVPLAQSSNIQTVNHHLILQSKLIVP